MKKYTLILCAVCFVLSLTGCKGASQPAQTEDKEFVFTYQNTDISINSEAGPIVEALGEPENLTEQPSCAFEGVEKTYFYKDFYFTTYQEGDKELIWQLWFNSDQAATAEGLRIGDPMSKAEQIYGLNDQEGGSKCGESVENICGGAYIVTRGDTDMTIIASGRQVGSIQYGLHVDMASCPPVC